MMLHLCMPLEQEPALSLQLFCTLKKEQNHSPFLLFAHLTRLDVVGAHPNFQSHVCPASSFSAFASALSFALTFFTFAFPASFRRACVWLSSGVWIPGLSALVALV